MSESVAPGRSTVPVRQEGQSSLRRTELKKSLDPLPPFGVYSVPEVAMAGLTEEAAAAQGIDYEIGRGWFDRNARAVIAGATEGLVKLLFRRDTRELLGVHILGDMAAELIHHDQCALHFDATIDLFIHSTYNVRIPRGARSRWWIPL
jgi:NAD(P) transhydrogenase